MLRKFSLIAAVAASLFIPTSVFAAHGGGHGGGDGHGGGGDGMHAGGGMHVGGGGMHAGGVAGRNVSDGGRGVGMHANGGARHFVGGGGGHFWHGRWYGYGVGSCWSLTPDGYVWVCG